MKTKQLACVLGIALAPATAGAWTLPSNVPRIPNYALADTAAATPTPSGPAIVYNPMVLAREPAGVQEFAFAHEYGHIVLGHLAHLEAQGIPAWAQQYEKEADCYAARVIDDAAAEQAAQFFEMTQGAMSGDARHPSGYERAQVIRACHAQASAERGGDVGNGEIGDIGDDDSTGDDDDTASTSGCHTVTRYRTETTYEMRTVTVMQAVPRCTVMMTAWGPQQMCMPVMMPVPVTQQVPVTHQVPETSNSCD